MRWVLAPSLRGGSALTLMDRHKDPATTYPGNCCSENFRFLLNYTGLIHGRHINGKSYVIREITLTFDAIRVWFLLKYL